MRGQVLVRYGAVALALVGCSGVPRVCADGLPGEFLVSGAWRATGSESSPLTNPAFILERSWLRACFTGGSLGGDYTMGDLGLSVPIGLYQTVGFSWMYQSAGEYDMKRFDEATQTDLVIGSMEDRTNILTLTYGVSPWKWVGAGANLNIVHNRFADESESAVGVDAGLTLRLPERRYLGRHVLGVAMQNAVAPVIGTAFSRTLNVAWSAAYAKRIVTSLVAFQVRDIGADASEGGSGTSWALDTKLGVWPFRIGSIYALLGFASEGVNYYGGAAGINLPVANRGRDLEAVYQYVSMREGPVMHSVYLQGEFGWNREDLHARMEERRRDALPRQLFERALALYDQGKYWEAFFTFARIKADHPRFGRMDAVDYYAARCLEAMDMREAAAAAYDHALRTYPASRFVPEMLLGMARIRYRDSDGANVEKRYRELQATPAPDSLVQECRYLYGQTLFRSGRFALAMGVLDSIPESHPLRPFAQYTAAVAELELKKPRAAEQRLLEIVMMPEADDIGREIVDLAGLKLGLVYLEALSDDSSSLPKAVSVLRRVRSQSMAYPDALTALSWTALKVRNYPDCIRFGRALLELRSAGPLLRAEGALVAGYALIESKDYIAALDVLEEGAMLLEAASLEPREPSSSAARKTYEEIAQRVVRLAYQKESDERLRAVSELRRRQMETKAELDREIAAATLAIRGSALRGRLEDLKADTHYLLAEATKRAATARAVEYQQRLLRKSQEYDAKIQQLREQLRER